MKKIRTFISLSIGSGVFFKNIQSYIGTNVNQVIGKIYVQQARGTDKFKYHEHTKRPIELMGKKDVALRIKANEELSKIFYSGAQEKGKY